MSMISYDSEEIITCLKNTYQSPDKNIRKSSEQKLNKLINQNLIEFISNLITIFKKQLDNNLRLSIILFLKNSIEDKIENNLITSEELNSLIQIYILILVDQNISKKELNNFKDTFIILINNSSYQILLEIITYLKKQISELPLGSINGLISILSCLINSSLIKKDKELFNSIFNPVIILTTDITENLYNKYAKIDLNKFNIEDYYKLNNIFFNIYELLFDSNIKAKKILEKENINENMINHLNKVYNIGIKLLVDINAKDNNRIISWTGQKEFDQNINHMKVSIFKFINLRLNKLNEYMLDKNSLDNHNQMIKIVMANLEWLIMNKFSYLIKMETSNINNEYPDYNYSLLISFMFIYLKRILGKKTFINEFTSEFNLFFKNILLPLLIITEDEEKTAFNNDMTNDYLIDINDILYENKQKNIKSQIGGLIKKVFEKNINNNNFMITYTINLIYFLFEETQNLCDKNLINENDIFILLIKVYSKDKIISTLFLVLNLFNENKKINKEENFDLMDNLFRNIFSIIEKSDNIYPLLKLQIILFIRNYSIKLYLDENLIFEKTIKYLYESLFDTKYLLISNSSADSIQKIFEYNLDDDSNKEDEKENYISEEEENNNNKNKINNIKYTLINLACNISNEFEKYILEAQIPNFFDVLSQIIISFDKIENNFFKNIFINICKRVNIEVKNNFKNIFIVEKDQEENNKKLKNLNNHEIIINKCFNIIKILLENKAFIFNNYELIENCLRPLIEYMDDPKKIKFDEDIIYIIYLLMKEREKVVGIGFNLIKNIYKYIDKCGSLYLESYQLLDKYISYGTNQILTNKKWYEGIFKAFMSGIKGDDSDKGVLYTCMLIQTWIIHCDKLPKDCLNSLFKKIFENLNLILDKFNKGDVTDKKLYNFLGYVTTIFSGLINYDYIIIHFLNNYYNEKVLKTWLKVIIKENDVTYEYEIKVLIYSICFIIKKEIFKNENCCLINLGLDLLNCQTKNSKYQLKRKTKKFIDINFIEDDDEENKEEENEDEEDIELNEIKMLLEKTSNPIKDLDEFKFFGDMLQYLKNNKNEIYYKWENNLNQEQKEKIVNLINTKRINIQTNEQGKIQVARRIVTIKRNQS